MPVDYDDLGKTLKDSAKRLSNQPEWLGNRSMEASMQAADSFPEAAFSMQEHINIINHFRNNTENHLSNGTKQFEYMIKSKNSQSPSDFTQSVHHGNKNNTSVMPLSKNSLSRKGCCTP